MEQISQNSKESSKDQILYELRQVFLHAKFKPSEENINYQSYQPLELYGQVFEEFFGEINPRDIPTIVQKMSQYDNPIKHQFVWYKNNISTIEFFRKWSYFPEVIREFGTYNCSGAAALLTSYLIARGYEAYLGNPVGHAVSIIKIDSVWYYLDPRNGLSQAINIDAVYDFKGLSFFLIKLAGPIATTGYSLIPCYQDFNRGINNMHAGNHRAMLNDLQSTDTDLKNAAKMFEQFLIYNNISGKNGMELSQNLPETSDLMGFKKSQTWQLEEKRVNLGRTVRDSISDLSKAINEQNLSVSEVIKQEQRFTLHFLTLAPDEFQNLIAKMPNNGQWIEVRSRYWANTEKVRLINPSLFHKQVGQFVNRFFTEVLQN